MIAKGGEREGNSTEESRHQGLVAGEFLTPLGSRIGDRRDYLSPEKKKSLVKKAILKEVSASATEAHTAQDNPADREPGE